MAAAKVRKKSWLVCDNQMHCINTSNLSQLSEMIFELLFVSAYRVCY